MRAAFFVLSIFAAHQVFSQNTDWTASELASANAEYSKQAAQISSERAAILSRIEELRVKIEEADSAIARAKERETLLSSGSEKSKYYDSCGKQIADACAEPSEVRSGASLAEAYELASRKISEEFEGVFNPLAPRRATAFDIRTGGKIGGETFRVGGARYFIGEGRGGFLSEKGVLYAENYAPEIMAFASGASTVVPMDTSGGMLFETAKTSRTFSDEIALGGIWMYPILFFGFISAAVLLYKAIAFAAIRRAPKDAVSGIFDCLNADSESGAEAAAKKCGYPYAGFLYELVKSRNLDASMLEEISYEGMLSAGERLFSGLSVLSVTAAVSPLFGLLGTVTGIIKIFADLSAQSAQQAQFLSAGISEALITTEYGLVVAIPAFVAHAVLSRRAKAVLSDMEKLAASFLAKNSKR